MRAYAYPSTVRPAASASSASVAHASDDVGWKGHGPVPWEHEANRGFLRALHALATAADAIHEGPEAERCRQFLADSSPTAARELG